MQALPTPHERSAVRLRTGVNAGGTICGYGNTAGRRRAALVWQGGDVRVLPPLPGGSTGAAYGINDAGQAAGRVLGRDGAAHMVWWDRARSS